MKITLDYRNPTPSHCDVAVFVNGALAGVLTLRQEEVDVFQGVVKLGLGCRGDSFEATGDPGPTGGSMMSKPIEYSFLGARVAILEAAVAVLAGHSPLAREIVERLRRVEPELLETGVPPEHFMLRERIERWLAWRPGLIEERDRRQREEIDRLRSALGDIERGCAKPDLVAALALKDSVNPQDKGSA